MEKDFVYLDMDIEEATKWLNNIKQGIGDFTLLFKALEPDIRKFAGHEFDGTNPNMWEQIKPSYKQWKLKQGFAGRIGVMRGNLEWGASEGAVVKYDDKRFEYKLNNSKTKTEEGKDYSKFFNKKRPIFRWTVMRLQSYIQGLTLKTIEGKLKRASSK